MTSQKALNLLDSVAAQTKFTRQEHIQVLQAVEVLTQLIKGEEPCQEEEAEKD